MPFLRFSRDKRGYENTYLVDTVARRGKPSRTRVLYWYRTPPGIRVGRPAFDPEVRRALESKYPNVTFDWEAYTNTPVPAPEPEYWRERRRAEKALKQARRQEEQEPAGADASLSAEEIADPEVEQPASSAAAEGLSPEGELQAGAASAEPARVDQAEGTGRRRRRRGGRRRRGRPGGGPGDAPEMATADANVSGDDAVISGGPDPDDGEPPDDADPSSEGE